MKGIVCIVDAYGPARQIPPYVASKGYACVHVQSTQTLLPRFAPPNRESFVDEVIHGGDLDATVAALRASGERRGLPVHSVVAGIEAGVDLADALSARMGLKGNRVELGRVRRNKFEMCQRLREVGLAAADQLRSSDLETILQWCAERKRWPVVLKPLDSGGTDGVHICRSAEEVRSAFARVVNTVNLMGQVNEELMVQSFLSGDEYIINSASCDGVHYTTDIWKSSKIFLPGRGFIYDREVLLPCEVEPQKQIIRYVHSVLDALGVNVGPSHAEVMMIETGPVLIEVGVRISGATNPAVLNDCVGCNQLELGMDAYLDPEAFFETAKTPYRMRKHGMFVVLGSEHTGIVQDTSFIEQMRALPSMSSLQLRIKPGDRITKTVDLPSSYGYIYLAHENEATMWKDYCRLKDIFADVTRWAAANS